MQDLDQGLRKLGSRLFVVRGKPSEVLPGLVTSWGVSRVTWEVDTEPYARARDSQVSSMLQGMKVQVQQVHGHTLWDPEQLLKASKGNMPQAYQSFVTLTTKLPPPAQPLPATTPQQLLPPLPGKVKEEEHRVPTMTEMGYNPAHVTTPFRGQGGESHALSRLTHHLARLPWLAAFSKPDTNPTALQPDTTALSPYLKFGCLGARQFYWGLLSSYAAARAAGRACTQPPTSLEGQLLWREFFYAQGYAVPHFDRMEGNPVCRQIAWGYDPALVSAWERSETGYPWIDAAMAQLRTEGWLHHLARHAVACFLTRGDLYQSWEHGARIFDKYLLDADWAINNGNWMWLSASAYFYQFFRVYSPVAFPKKTDPKGDYVRKHLPLLAGLPDKFIYEPWKAPAAVLQAAGVYLAASRAQLGQAVPGKGAGVVYNYPMPIVEHETASKANIAAHSAAYAAHKEGAAAIARLLGTGTGPGGIGGTQVGSDPRDTEAFCEKHGVQAGQLPAGSAAGSSASTAAGAGASASSSCSSGAGVKRKAGGVQTELSSFYQRKAKEAKVAGAGDDQGIFAEDLAVDEEGGHQGAGGTR